MVKRKILTDKWVKQPEWWGNPELGFDCWGKKFGDLKVYVVGKKDRHKEEHVTNDYFYVVKGEFSGMLEKDTSAEQLMDYLDFRFEIGILDSGRSLTETEKKEFLEKYGTNY